MGITPIGSISILVYADNTGTKRIDIETDFSTHDTKHILKVASILMKTPNLAIQLNKEKAHQNEED